MTIIRLIREWAVTRKAGLRWRPYLIREDDLASLSASPIIQPMRIFPAADASLARTGQA
ncbi:hypothetical protein NKI66_32235 [Mesorhizobium sp. M0518]|uniref:hypothetical protein n=1 Tax=Mesorhizobium sp. M0518 TaxID=2956956 RepID=UPI003335E5E8